MRNAASILVLALSALGLVACSKPSSQAGNQDISVEGNLAYGQLPANAEIETLPPDESSETSSNELATGDDNLDVGDVNAASNSE
jgi:hypothetical protein